MARKEDKPWFHNRYALAHRVKQKSCGVWSRSRTQADWEEHRVARRRAQLVYGDAERAFTERSKSLLTNAPNSFVKTAVLEASSSWPPLVDRGDKVVWSAEE